MVGCAVLLCQSLMFAAIAASKLYLYISSYGFTPRRLQSAWLIAVLAAGTGCALYSLVTGKKTVRYWMLFSAAGFLGVLALGILSLLFPLLSRFENTLGMLLKNTVLLGFAYLPRTLALGIVNGAAIFLCARFVFPLFFLPALAALISSLFVEPIFKPFMPEEITSEAAE